MNNTSFTPPWVEFILHMWLKSDLAENDVDIREKAKSLGIITEDTISWRVNKDWFHDKLASDKEIFNIKSPEDFALLILGLGEFMARTTTYLAGDIVQYISKAPAIHKVSECLLCIESKIKEHFSTSLNLSPEAQGELQFVNNAKITPKDFQMVDRFLGNGPRMIIRNCGYGLPGALKLLLKIDAPTTGVWLQRQNHPLILDAALYALKYAFMMILSPGHEKEISQLTCSNHPLISLTGLVITHSANLENGQPVWSIPLDEAFKLLDSANIPIGVSIWASLFRIAESSEAYERGKRFYEESEKHYAYAAEDPNYLYGDKKYHHENMERQAKQSEFSKNVAKENIQEIIAHWPQKGLSKEALEYCAGIISFNDIGLEFLKEIPVSGDKEHLIKQLLKKFIHSSDLFKHDDHTHCFATKMELENADFAAKAFLLLKSDNLGRSFGKLFFSDKKESLRFDEQILSEPYAYIKSFEKYQHALNALGIAHYIAMQIGTKGYLQRRKGAEFLIRNGTLGLLKVISAAQGSWDVADEALKTFSMFAIETICFHEHLISDKEIEAFLFIPHLKYSLRAMLGLAKYELFELHSEHIFSLLKQSLWVPAVVPQHYENLISSFLAFDYALMRFVKFGNIANAHSVVEMWEKGSLNQIDPIPKALDGALKKMKAALLGDKQCSEWLVSNPALSNTWSANYIRTKSL